MLKTCYVCGAKENKLYDGMCEKCLKDKSQPVDDVKPLNLKICNMCKKIHYQNGLYSLEEFYDMLPSIMKKRVKMNENYVLKGIKIDNYGLEAENLVFDVNVESDLKE